MIQTTPPPAAVEGAPVKPGKTTTEFWGKLLVQAAVLLNSWFDIGVEMDLTQALTIVAGLEGLYMVVRGVVKASSYKTVTVVEKETK